MMNYGWNNLNDLVLAPRAPAFSIFEQNNASIEEILEQDNIVDDIRFHFNTASH
jgi:hypothetical protein